MCTKRFHLKESLEEINIRTFTKWINSKLGGEQPAVKNLIKDLQDGRVLLSLLEVLLKVKLRAEKGKLKFHKINNVNKVLKTLEDEGLKLHGISPEAIVDGNKISILGLVWIIILHFQVQGIMFEEDTQSSEEKTDAAQRKKSVASQADVERLLLKWIQDVLKGFSDVVTIEDILKSWQNGLAFILLMFVYRPTAVDIDKAQKMAVLERLEYAFDVAEKEFDVHRLLDPSDVEQGNVDKKAMLMYLSALYEVLRNLEPAVVETTTTTQEVSEEPGEEGIVKSTTSFVVESAPGSESTTLRIGDEDIDITTVSSNEIVLQYKTIYYTVLYTIKGLEKRMEKIRNEEPSQENARALREIQKEMHELQAKVKELNETNKEMSKADGVDRQEFSDIQKELRELSSRWSTLIQHSNEESKRQPAVVREIRTSTTYQTARLTIGDKVIEITSVSTNEIVIRYKIVYYKIIYIIERIESNMRIIKDSPPSQETARLLDENKQRMEQLKPQIAELKELMSEMRDADGVDADELAQLQSELSDFDSRLSSATEDINEEEKRQPSLATETVYRTTTIVESESSVPTTTTLRIGDEDIDITTVSSNEIVLQYKTIYYTVLYTIKGLEARMEKIRNEEPSQENAKALREINKEMQELQVKIKELNETNREMSKAEGVDRQEFSEIQTELGQLGSRWSALIQHCNDENKRQPRIVTYKTTTTVVPRHKARLTIGDEVIEITCVSTNEIVIKYKIVYYQIITIMKIIESNMKVINEEEPSQKTAILLDENRQRMEQLKPKITELNELMSQMKDADGVDADELAQLQSELSDFDSKLETLNEDIKNEEKRQPQLTTRITYTTETRVVDGGRTYQLRDGDKVIEIKTVSTNEIVMRYKILYYQIITIMEVIDSNTTTIREGQPSQETARLLLENKYKMEQLQPKITELNKLMAEMKNADGVDADELSQLQYEMSEFDSRMGTLNEDIKNEEKRQPPIQGETISRTTTTTVQSTPEAPARRTTVKYGDSVFEITTISTNEIVVRYKVLYYEIMTLVMQLEKDIAQIKDAPPSNTTSVMLKQSKDQMAEIQAKINELQGIRKNMDGEDGVDPEELKQLHNGLESLVSRWTIVTHDIETEDERITSHLDSSGKQKTSLDEWRKKCEKIGDWMDSVEDSVEVLENRKPSSDIFRAKQQMNECDGLEEKIKSDEVPRSTFAYGEEITNEPSLNSDQKSKIRLQMTEMKKEIKKLSDRAGDAKHRYKRAVDKLEADRKQKLVDLNKTYQELDKEIDVLIQKDDKIGAVEGNPAEVRAKETQIELLVSDIHVFQPRFDEFRQTSWEVLEDPTIDQSQKDRLQKQVTSSEERWGTLIRSVYSRSEAAKRFISGLPQGGVLEELIIVENRRHDYNLDWKMHHDLFGAPGEHDEGAVDEEIYRERLMTKWKRECREVDEALSDVEKESSELGEIIDEPNKTAMKNAKMQVIREGLKKVEKEYNDLPEYAKLLLDDPKLVQDDRQKIQEDLGSYKIRFDDLTKLVSEREETIKRQEPPKSTVVVTENYVTERKSAEIIVPEILTVEESAPDALFSEPEVPGNSEEIDAWWGDDRKVVSWIERVDSQVKVAEKEPSTLDLTTTRRQHANIERMTQEIGVYETNVTLLENKANAIVSDPVTKSEDGQNIDVEIKTVKKKWDSLKERAFNVERVLYEQVNKLQEYLNWTQKSEALSGWLEDTERSLDSCAIPSSDPVERGKQTLFLEKFLKERGQNQESVDDVLSHGNLVVKKNLVPDQHLSKIKEDLNNYRDQWDKLLKKAEDVQERLTTGKKDLKQLEDNRVEYDVITTWIIKNEKRLQELKDDTSGDEEALKRRRVVILEIIEEITIYRVRLRRLIGENDKLANKDTLPPDERDKFVNDTKELEKRLDALDDGTKKEESSINDQIDTNNTARLDEWQTKADDLDKWFITTKTEITSFNVPPLDEHDKARQDKYLEDFAKQKPACDKRVNEIVSGGRSLVNEGVIPSEKREQFEVDLESISGTWDSVIEMADDSSENLEKAEKASDDYDVWRKDATQAKEIVENNKKDVEEASKPTSDPEERKSQITTMTKIMADKPGEKERLYQIIYRGKDLEDSEYLTPEQKEHISRETKDIENNWNDFSNQLDDAKKSAESGKKDLQDLAKYRVDYDVIITWIITNEKRLRDVKDDDSNDKESIQKQQVILKSIIGEFPEYKVKLNEVISKGRHLSNTPSLPNCDREEIDKQSNELENKFNTLENDVNDEDQRLEKNLENIDKYEVWQQRADDVKEKLDETKDELDKFDTPTSDVSEREKQKRFLNDFNKRKGAQEKLINDVVSDGRKLVDENIAPSDKREKIELDLQSLPETWEGIVGKADENKKTVDSSLQDAVQLSKWQNDYNVVLLWIEKAEDKQNQREEDSDDLDKLKKQRKKLEVDVKDIAKYEAKIAPLLARGETISQSNFITPDDKSKADNDTKTLKERFDKLKNEETDRKQRLDDKIQWITEYKQYRTDYDGLNSMLDDCQHKLESYEKPTSNKTERDRQAAFLNKFNKDQPANDKRVETVVQFGSKLADAPGVPEDKGDDIKEETKTIGDTWRIIVLKVEELQKIVRSGIQNITELSDWRKEYTTVIKWIETNEKKLAAQGEPGDQAKDLANKCTTLDEMVNVLSTYETRITILLQKGDQLANEPSIDESDRKKTEDDTKALRERWDKLKQDEEDKKNRFDNQKSFVEDYQEWKDDVDDLKPWMENTKKEIDACELPTSDNSVREKQANFVKVFLEDKEKNQARVDKVVDGGNLLLKENPVAQKDKKEIQDKIENTQNSWSTIVQRFDVVQPIVISGTQDIVKLDEWRNDCSEMNKSIDNARQQVRNLKKPSKDRARMEKQKDDFEVISAEMDGNPDRIDSLSERAEYLVTVSTISPKDKDKVSKDMNNLKNTWNNYKNEEKTAKESFDAQPQLEVVTEFVVVEKKEDDLVVEGTFEDIDELFAQEPKAPEPPATVDYGEWKNSVEELEGILDKEDGKFDPKAPIEKEYSNLEKLAQETKDSGATVDDQCKPKLATILSDGNALVNNKELQPEDQAFVTEKMISLKDRTQRIDMAVRITRMKVRDAALEYFNETLNKCSVDVNKMQETGKSLRPPSDNLPDLRVQIASMKSLEKRLSSDGEKVQDTEEKVNNMEDAGVLPRDGFAGTLNDRCNEVKKEQKNVFVVIDEAKPKLHRALVNQLNRTQKSVNNWLKSCEKKERNIDMANVKDLNKAHQECLKLKQVKAEFYKGEPLYITLNEVHKEAVDDEILVEKKAVDFAKQMETLGTRHDDLKQRLQDKDNELLTYVRQTTEGVLKSSDEKLDEQKTWLQPEEPADNFTDAKEQQDTMKERESIIKQRTKDIIIQLGPIEKISTGEILPLPESTSLQRRIGDIKTRFNADIPTAREKSQKLREGYGDLLKKEVEKRKLWLDENEGVELKPETDFKDFSEFKIKYDQNKDFVKELDDNNIKVLIEEADKIDGIEPELKNELVQLDERWATIHDDAKDKTENYEDLMTKWTVFREQQLTLLNWIDKKDAEAAEEKDQVNLADEDEVAEHVKKLKDAKEEAEGQGESQEKKLKEASEDLIRHLGEDSPAADEVKKQTEEVDSVRQKFINDMGDRIEKIESSEEKTRDLYNDIDDVTNWLDTTENLIDKYENHEKETADDGSSREQHVRQDGEVEEEMVHVVEDLLIKRKEIPEFEARLDNAESSAEHLDDQLLDESTVENTQVKVKDMKVRWGVVTQRLDEFCNRDIPEIEIAQIKAEHLEEDSLDETDMRSVVPLDVWREKVRKVNLLLKYVERLVGVNADGKEDYASIRILASNTKEATKTITLYCKPRVQVIKTQGINIISEDPHDIDRGEEITDTIDSLRKRVETSENNAGILKMKVRDLALDYFNNRLNHCEIALESEEENVEKLLATKPDIETTQEQMVLLKEGRKEFDKNKEDYENVVNELKDKKIVELLTKDGFQGTLADKSQNIKKRRDAVEKKLSESKTRIHRNLISHLSEMKKVVGKWLASCEKKEKSINVEPSPTHDPVAEYKKLMVLLEDLNEGESKYDSVLQLNKQLISDNVLEGRKASSSEKDLQSFATRFAVVGKRVHDKNGALYIILLNLAQTTMDEAGDNIAEMDEKVEQTNMAERFPQIKQDFQNAKSVKDEVDDFCEKSKETLKDVHVIIALDAFNNEDKKNLDERRNELKDKNSQLSEKSDEKFDNFAKEYNKIIDSEVRNRKMWFDSNESWMGITDHDVDNLPGFAKKLDDQTIFQEELEHRKMEGLIDEARDNEDLSPETRFLIYDLDDKWSTMNSWSEERLDRLTTINEDWEKLRKQEKDLLDEIDDNDARLKLLSSPVDLSDKEDIENQRNELKDAQSSVQELQLNVVKMKKVSNDLVKLVGPDSPAGKRMENEFNDVNKCYDNLCVDTLERMKKLDSSERKAKTLYNHMDDINLTMEESENILSSLNDEIKKAEEKKDIAKGEEINENEEEELPEKEKEKQASDLNKFVDQISLRLGERPEEKARVQRAKELEASLNEDLGEEARDVLQKQVEEFDNRWDDLNTKMDQVVKERESEEPAVIKAIQVEEVESSLPEDLTVDYGSWKGDAAEIDESLLKSQNTLQEFDVDVKDYSSLTKVETETQDIIDKMNTEFKPKLISLRSSGEKISDQDPAVAQEDVDDIVNSSQKNLEGLQSALELRKLRLRDAAVQHINDRILECDAKVGDEKVKLQLITPPGKDLDTVLDQLSALENNEETFQTNQVQFEEVQVHLNELKKNKILTAPEFQEQFQDDCKDIAIERAQILKQTKDHKNKLYRALINIFDVRRKEITKWLKNCEKKSKEIPNDIEDLDEGLVVVKKIKEMEDVLAQGEPNYHETVELSKTVLEKEVLVDKKAKDAENDMKNSSIRYNEILEDVQNRKNSLYKTIYELLSVQLDETEQEIKKGEQIVQIESKPEDPAATHEELSNLQSVVSTSDKLEEDSGKLFDTANTLLSADIFPQDDKREIRKRVIDLDKRTYELPDAAKEKYEKVYAVYLTNLTKLIQIRTEWITSNESRLDQTDTTDALDIPDLENKLDEHEEFQRDLKTNNVRSVLGQIRDTGDIDPDVPLSELQSLEKRWDEFNAWAEQRKIFLQGTLVKWKAFRQEQLALVDWIDKKDAELQVLDTPVNLADENAVQQRLEMVKSLQSDVIQQSPSLVHFKNTGQALLVNLNPQSEGAEKVNKQIEDFDNCWKKLEKDIESKIEKIEKSNRTIKAIYSYMDIVSNWLDDTDGKLNEVDSTKDQLRPACVSPLSHARHSVDGAFAKEPEEEPREDEEQKVKTGDEADEDTTGSKGLSEDEREQLQSNMEHIKDDIKGNSQVKDLNKARIERVRLLVDDIQEDVDEDGVNSIEARICEIGERFEQIDTRLGPIIEVVKSPELSQASSETELVTFDVQRTVELQSTPPSEPTPAAGTPVDTVDMGTLKVTVEPYSGHVTLDMNQWRSVVVNFRDFLHRLQMNIRDVDSKDYEEMRECESDTKACIDAMEAYGRPCLIDLTKSAQGMLESPEYTEDEKNEIRATLESLTVGAQFVDFNTRDQRFRLYRALISYQGDQRKKIHRWINSCSKESKEINEDVAGLEASDAEYKKVQHLKSNLASGEPTFLHYKELSKRMIENNIFPVKKVPEIEKDVANFTTTYDNLRADTERKDKRLYTTVVKSIGQPLHSIELAVTEGENWVEPEELSSDYEEAKEQLNKMKLSVFVIETLHTRSAKVLKETEALVLEHEYLSPENKEEVIERVHSLSPRTDGLPAAAVNKYKRMNREFLVLIESEVEIRDAWITKNEGRMSLPQAGDVQDLEGFQQLKQSHEDFLRELKRNEMSEFLKVCEGMSDLKKQTIAKVRALQTRWAVLLAWATKRTVYLNTVIANWEEFRSHEVTTIEFIDAKEKNLQNVSEEVKPGDDAITKERVEQLENMQAETRENSLDIWKLQQESSALTKNIGEEAPSSKNIQKHTNDLVERNRKLSQDISIEINELEANQHKALKVQQLLESVNDWADDTSAFLDEFNEIAVQLKPSDVVVDKAAEEDGDGSDKINDKGEKSEQDLEKVDEGRIEKLKTANELIHKIAYRRVDIGEYQALVDRVNELHEELPRDPDQTSEQSVQVEQLNTKWKNFNTDIDKVAWVKIPGLDSLQAVTYILHDMKVDKKEDGVAGVETFKQWKEKALDLETSVSEVESKFKAENNIDKSYEAIEAVDRNIQECQDEIDSNVLPKLEVIRLAGVNLCSPPDATAEPVPEEIKTEVLTTVLSLHERIENLRSAISLQILRLEDVIYDYFHQRVRSDQSDLAQEQTEYKRLLPLRDDVDTIILHLEIIKQSEDRFYKNEKKFKESQKQFNQLDEKNLINDKDLVTFVTSKIKNIEIQRVTLGNLFTDIEGKLRRSLLNKYNSNKSKFSKWLKNAEKREKTIDINVEGVEKAFIECTKLESMAEALPEGEEMMKLLNKLVIQIDIEHIWSQADQEASNTEVNSFRDRHSILTKSMEEKRTLLQAKIKEGLEQTLGIAEKSISDAEAWDKPSTLDNELEQATAQIQQSMENVTNVNNMYTQTMQALKRPQEIAQSEILPADVSSDIDGRCRDLTKRVGRLPSVVLKNHKSLFEAFTVLLHEVVDSREEWISQNEANVMVSFVSVASLDDVKSKIQDNKEFILEIKKHDMAPVLVELEKMSDPDFKLKATSKDLQSRLAAIEKSAEERQLVLLSILNQWEALRQKLRELLDWIDMKDLKLKELKEQVDLGDEDEVKGELGELKLMQTQMEDEHPEVVNLKKIAEGLKNILGEQSDANALVDEQIKDFIDCWNNLGKDIDDKIRKLESSERQLTTMHRYMDNTQDWMDDVTEILDQYEANQRRLQGLPPEDKPKESVGETEISDDEPKVTGEEPNVSEEEAKVSEEQPDVSGGEPKDPSGEQPVEMTEVSEVEAELKELDEDGKEELREKNKSLMKAFVEKRQNCATCQAFVDWAGELEKQVTEDLDDASKDVLKIRIEKFNSSWDVFMNKIEDFSQENLEEIEFIEFQLAEQKTEVLPEAITFEEWKSEISSMEVWFDAMDEKCSQVNISRDTDSLKKGEQDTKVIVAEFNDEGKPRFNKIIVLGRKLIDAKSQTPEEEQVITVTITKFTKRMIELERVVELHRIRTVETIVDYCKEKLVICESSVERDEVNMNQLTPSGSTPDAVHEQIVLLKICEVEIPKHEEEFVEIQTYILETREPGFITSETQEELEKTCKLVEKRRSDVEKQKKESHGRLYRSMVNFFDQRKKVTLKWLGSCEKKERQIKPDVKELKDSKNEYIKVKEVRSEFDQGRQNFVAFIEVHKLIVADEVTDEKKTIEVERDVNSISGRVEQVDKILHEQETKLYTTLLSTLTVLLDSIEATLSDARGRIKPDEAISTYFKTAKKQMDETKTMARDIQVIHLTTNKQLELGDDVKKAKLLGPEDADTIELRLSDLTKKSADLQEAAQNKDLRMRAEYVMTFKTELQRCSQWITFLELRVEKSAAEAEDYQGYKQLKEDHIHFEEDLKVYDLNMLLKEVGKIDELEPSVKQELAALEKRWKKLLRWSEERSLRLSKIVSLWSKFREEEILVLNWIDEKGEELKVADQVNLADEEALQEQLHIFKALTPEREEFVKRSTEVEDMGHELKRIVGDNTRAGDFIQKQLVDLDQVFNELIKQIIQKNVQLESALERLRSMSAEMTIVKTWCNETELLLNEYDVMEKRLQDLNVGKSDPPPVTGEQTEKTETKREKRARIKEEKAELREEMIQNVENLAKKFEKLPATDLKVKHVNTLGNELKGEISDEAKDAVNTELEAFNERFNSVSQRLKDMENRDLPEGSGCWFVRFMRRKMFRASIN
ncbi:nuclear anchorage protein 1-like isoform X2 [Dendronephthya gigantea]|uniref:nuclear anchorage protein 1-like isoform X2 n=1 Tax=Dendronephthya gigantea TaxID=151771 RepID=UPI00106DBC4B|nr:nuclear anchorage protein 1-like isoform X2 [Dendronephthya gigantea]